MLRLCVKDETLRKITQGRFADPAATEILFFALLDGMVRTELVIPGYISIINGKN